MPSKAQTPDNKWRIPIKMICGRVIYSKETFNTLEEMIKHINAKNQLQESSL